MTTDTIGFLGLGSMGGPITTRLASWAQRMPGKRILAYDPRPEALAAVVEAGAQPMRSVAEIAAHCPVVFACLASPEISEAVALGPDGIASAPGRQVTTYVEMSTIGSETIRRLAAGLAARGAFAAFNTRFRGSGLCRGGGRWCAGCGYRGRCDQGGCWAWRRDDLRLWRFEEATHARFS